MFVVVLCALLAVLDALTTYRHRGSQLYQATSEATDLARSFADHAQNAFHLADAVLQEFRDDVESEGLGTGQIARLNDLLSRRVKALNLLRFVFLTDAHGNVVVSSTALPPGGISIADRDYFRKLSVSSDRQPLLGTLDQSRLDASWTVRIARRINRPDGGFAGTVVATIDLGFFQRYYRDFNVGRSGTIRLMTTDGRLMAREPFLSNEIGADRSATTLFTKYLPRSAAANFETSSRLDAHAILVAYRRLDDFPLLAAVTFAKAEILAPWRWEAWTHVAGVGAIILVVAVFGHGLSGQIRERERVERDREALAAEHRMLTENSTDLVTRLGPDLAHRYVSPSSQRILGYEPEELVGHTMDIAVHSEDWPETMRALLELLDPAGPEAATFEYHGLRRDGSTIWLEASGKRLVGAEGLVITCRDISLRKEVEARLEELTRLDALTGLTNRRGFDTWLSQQFRRAARAPAFISLIMIDVDRFKPFNDGYGHQAGDDCLRVIADAIKASSQRPGDVAARYGGEEIALLLPDTDLNGALTVAERARAAVFDLRIPHEASDTGNVTISLGVASVYAGRGHASADRLIKAADEALYAAKHSGRNKVQSAGGIFAAHRPQVEITMPVFAARDIPAAG